MKHLIALAVVAAVAVTAATAIAAERSYSDEAGDSGTAPDLTNVTVTDSNGYLAFKIAGTLVPSSSFGVFIDTDRNQSTGGDGDELFVGVEMESDGKGYWFAQRWNGTKWVDAGIDVDSQRFTGRHEIGFRAAEAGVTGPFDFVVSSIKMVADAVEGRDRAPDSVVPWTYELTAQKATAVTVFGQIRLTPARPLAGKPVTVRVPVSRSDTKQPLTSGVATCSARVRGKTVRGTASVARGWATCRLVVPRSSAGSTGRGSLTVGSGAQAVTTAFTLRIA